ncbi:MAG: flagellar basal body L-ring protein FlgH [Chloroherpetonaceae bacterium]|nr:flagellar basal body L-ring protein FlgH [Chthonomonadaceae bacterium]MDW8207715.1 flagellar basal body L-ring protein FlgH [Chloroherpetonaceae bacterium]
MRTSGWVTGAQRAVLCATMAGGVLCVAIQGTSADSLFPIKQANRAIRGSSSASAASLFSDVRAHNVGDVLYVTVSETSSAQSAASVKASQDENVSALNGSGLFRRLFRELTFSANQSREANGSGQTTRTGTLVTALSVVVKEVLPNGTLRIEGSRLITINRETQRMVFSGIIRPEDISFNNTIPSTLVAEASIRFEGKGVVADTQRAGLLTRIFRILF